MKNSHSPALPAGVAKRQLKSASMTEAWIYEINADNSARFVQRADQMGDPREGAFRWPIQAGGPSRMLLESRNWNFSGRTWARS